MRRLLVAMLAVLAVPGCACPPKPAAGPAWPAASTTADDGGESLAPRHASAVSAVERSAEPEPEAADTPATTDPATSADVPAADADKLPASTSPGDEVIFTDDMIIEIED